VIALHTTFNKLRAANACASGYRTLAEHLGGVDSYGADTPINLLTILESNGVQDVLWCLRATLEPFKVFHEQLRGMYADFAESVLHIYEAQFPEDMRPRNAIAAARTGKAAAAYAAADAASYAADAASYAADAASYAAYAASDAASDAAYAASYAAYAASYAAYAASNAAYAAYAASNAAYAAYAASAASDAAYAASDAAYAAYAASDAASERTKQALIIKQYLAPDILNT
jgi:hypothetical protein